MKWQRARLIAPGDPWDQRECWVIAERPTVAPEACTIESGHTLRSSPHPTLRSNIRHDGRCVILNPDRLELLGEFSDEVVTVDWTYP